MKVFPHNAPPGDLVAYAREHNTSGMPCFRIPLQGIHPKHPDTAEVTFNDPANHYRASVRRFKSSKPGGV